MNGIDVYSTNKSEFEWSRQINDRNSLLQRIELLEMENSELRKREQYLKMVNSTLLEALGNKQGNKQVGEQRQEMQYYQSQPAVNYRSSKMNSSIGYQQKNQYGNEERQKQSIYKSRDSHETYKQQFDLENEELFPQKQKLFSKTKASNFYEKRNLNQLFKRSSTPKADNRFSNKFSNSTLKSQNILIDSLQNQNSFYKRNNHLPTSIKGQKSVSRTLNSNVATALLCDICGLSYSPLQFISHAQQCQSLHQSEITNQKSFSQSQQSYHQSDQQQQILYNLQQQKNSLLNQINRIKKNKNISQKKLQKNLDQIVFIINNKKSLNQKDIKNLLKQKNTYMTPITRRK